MKQGKDELSPTHSLVVTWIPAVALMVSLTFWATGFDAFNFSKQSVLLAGIGSISFFYIAGIRRKKFTRIELFFSVSILVIISLTFIFYKLDSQYWWGIFGRANGSLTSIAFLLSALIITTYFSSKLLDRIFQAAFLALILQCIYGIVQFLKLDPIPWENPHSPVVTFFGNPNFAAASFGFLTIALLRFFNFKKQNLPGFVNTNFLLILVFIVALFLNYKTESIQGLATLLLGLYVFLGLRYVSNVKEPRRGPILKFGFFTIPILVGLGFGGWGPLGALLRQETFLNRIEYWRVAFNILKDNFWFGVGPDAYGQFYQQYRSLEYTVKYGPGLNSSAAHNVFLQCGTSYGIFGLVIYATMLSVCIRRFFAVNRIINSGDKHLFHTTFTLWVTYQATALISMEQIGLAIWGWVFTGIILGWSNRILGQQESKFLSYTVKKNLHNSSSGLDGLVFLMIVLLAFPATSHFRNDLALRKAIQIPGISNGVEGSLLNDRADEIYRTALPLSMDRDYLQFAVTSLYREGTPIVGQKLAQESLIKNERNTVAIEALAIAGENLNNWNDVIKYRRLITTIDPNNYFNEAKLGEALYKAGRKIEALKTLKSAIFKGKSVVELDPYRQLQVLIEAEVE